MRLQRNRRLGMEARMPLLLATWVHPAKPPSAATKLNQAGTVVPRSVNDLAARQTSDAEGASKVVMCPNAVAVSSRMVMPGARRKDPDDSGLPE